MCAPWYACLRACARARASVCMCVCLRPFVYTLEVDSHKQQHRQQEGGLRGRTKGGCMDRDEGEGVKAGKEIDSTSGWVGERRGFFLRQSQADMLTELSEQVCGWYHHCSRVSDAGQDCQQLQGWQAQGSQNFKLSQRPADPDHSISSF